MYILVFDQHKTIVLNKIKIFGFALKLMTNILKMSKS